MVICGLSIFISFITIKAYLQQYIRLILIVAQINFIDFLHIVCCVKYFTVILKINCEIFKGPFIFRPNTFLLELAEIVVLIIPNPGIIKI